MLDPNVYQYGALLHKFTLALQKRGKRSAIIAVSSVLGQFAMGGSTVYCATKAFVKYLCKALAWELAE